MKNTEQEVLFLAAKCSWICYDIGRAKSRAFEHNSGSATGNFLSSITVTDTTFKHYLFDIEMFAHINVKGAMSWCIDNR